jgi:hypothetical protein
VAFSVAERFVLPAGTAHHDRTEIETTAA